MSTERRPIEDRIEALPFLVGVTIDGREGLDSRIVNSLLFEAAEEIKRLRLELGEVPSPTPMGRRLRDWITGGA